MSKNIALVAALVGALAVTGCATKTVNDVMADPSRYADRNITLKGEVVESYSVAGNGFYRLQDPTGRLWIFSNRGVPRKGAYVQVKGKVKDGFDLTSVSDFLSLPEPIRERIESGLLLIESSHKASS